ncbi:hypothetical protein SAMN05216553_10392 [Lentzea fradiae]|uniref:Uncharacterized protein n=1 Tax=Lentzea fradiae TaxID=200378 RepID=A0A1G7NM12_9PSEU|nr:hypothetical protein [Lentzea fradiae]SDF75043.1 hypothetical protein SAMN05216553_10392 [Lentzea fradiae]
MTTDEAARTIGHDAALSRLKNQKDKVLYALDHLPRGCTVEDVRRWLNRQGQDVPSRPYATKIVNEWRARNSVTDTAGNLPLTPELLAKLDGVNKGVAAHADALTAKPVRPADTPTVVTKPVAPAVTFQAPATTQPLTEPAAEPPTAPPTGLVRPTTPAVPAALPTAEPAVTPEPASGEAPGSHEPAGAKGFYLVALLSIGVSVDTSWRFFEQRLGITDTWERVALFSVMEAALVACGWAMRGGVRRDGRPGPARLVAWALTAFAAFAALSLSGPVAGTARVLLGPVLGLVMLHLALGIEIRATRQRATTWARVGREFRERLLSLFGLGDDHRDALARTRDRAALRAAKLALASRWTPRRKARLRKALHVSNVAHDPVQRDKMLRELGVLQHADKLASTSQPAPW